jgi:ferredoxin
VKWIGVGLMVVFFFGYERFALWNSPARTACLLIAYVGAAFLVDTFFRGASFCKYVCPIGQFNFVQSLASPLEVKARDPAVCESCHTKDCIRGNGSIPGCELHLFLPRKSSNMDCTTCLDCVHACPHDNVGLLASTPAAELWDDRQRSGIGRFSRRPDLVVLILVLVFGAFVNAGGMVEPVIEWQDRMAHMLALPSASLMTAAYYLFGLVVIPLFVVGAAAVLSSYWGRQQTSMLQSAMRYAYALVPLGFAMWLAHYSFHFVTSYDSIVPTTQRLLGELGWSFLGEPHWVRACCRPTVAWLARLEILFLDLGFLLSLYAAYRIAKSESSRPTQTLKSVIPWAILIGLLFAIGVWLVLQPMQMRGALGA